MQEIIVIVEVVNGIKKDNYLKIEKDCLNDYLIKIKKNHSIDSSSM